MMVRPDTFFCMLCLYSFLTLATRRLETSQERKTSKGQQDRRKPVVCGTRVTTSRSQSRPDSTSRAAASADLTVSGVAEQNDSDEASCLEGLANGSRPHLERVERGGR
jgi:hypothetical protein